MGLEAVDLYRKMPHHLCNEVTYKNKQIITTMIDYLSRLYIFDEAQKLIDDYEKSNPPSSVMFMAILSGAQTLISGFLFLFNTYSPVGDHQQVENFRSNRIRELGTKVKPGISWTEFNDEILEFKANNRSHPRFEEIYGKAKRISDVLIKYGYDYDSSWITRLLREDERI
ncbi:unnamed protein product, partial [Rotaria sordida]